MTTGLNSEKHVRRDLFKKLRYKVIMTHTALDQ